MSTIDETVQEAEAPPADEDQVRIVKFLSVHFYVDAINPLAAEPNNKMKVERSATYGARLHTGPGTNTQTDFYNVPASEILRLETQHGADGIFFTPGEIRAMEMGLTPPVIAPESTDSLRAAVADGAMLPTEFDPTMFPVAGAAGVPVSFDEMAPWQVAEFIRSNNLTPEQIIETVQHQPNLADLFLNAEHDVTGGDPRPEVVKALSELKGVSATGPADHTGVVEALSPNTGEGVAAPVPEFNAEVASLDELISFYNEHLSVAEDDKLPPDTDIDTAHARVVERQQVQRQS